jgi:hypothetical protein
MYQSYEACIEQTLKQDIKEWQFKSNPSYTAILEHVTRTYGEEYYTEIMNRYSSFFNEYKTLLMGLCVLNDTIGNPKKETFEGFTTCSPTNLRYIFHTLLIFSHMKGLNINTMDIIEIGGGYGGLCFFIHALAPIHGLKISSYTIFDLPAALKLQRRYLENLSLHNVRTEHLDSFATLKTNSFLISNYAFSEIPMELQIKYTNKVLNPYVSHGFLTWNFINVYQFIKDKVLKIIPDIPKTPQNTLIVTF